MKKHFLFLVCALISVGAQADSEQVKVKVNVGESEVTLTTLMGEPTPFQQMDPGKPSTCHFKSAFGGTSDLAISRSSEGFSLTVLPVEGDAYGVKVFLDISKTSGPVAPLATITKDCQLPVGETSTLRIGKLDTYKWNKPTKLKFADGSFVTVTVEK